jgi:hypothetical protein
MEAVDLGSRPGDEGEVDRSAQVAMDDDEVGELRATLVLSQRRDLERGEHGPVEARARGGVAHADLDVIEDDALPVPLDHEGDRTTTANPDWWR